MIDTKAIRSKILDLAMRGQLTEQRLEDGTAMALYQKIQDEKVQLSKTGELFREKPIKAITSKDIPYPIHEHWLWVRLGELSKVITKGSSPKWQGVNYTDADNGILFVTSENVGNGQMLFEKRKYVQKQFNDIHPSSILQRGDILTNIVGASIGRTALFDEDTKCANTNQAVCIIRLIDRSTSDYILRYLCGESAIRLMLGKVVDTARANLSLTSVSNLMVPLPPLPEQRRIVEIIDQSFAVLDTIDVLQAQYADNLTALKAKLIDAAIQGKLTEQLPEDGTAEELYQQIQAERKRQEEAGMIKTVELTPVISTAEMPFAIPTSWMWTTLGNVSYIVRGGSPRPIKEYITTREDGINWIKIGDVEKGGKYIYSTHEKIIPEGESKSRRVYPGDFLLTNSMSFGRPYISKIEGCIHDGWLLIRDLTGFDQDYLYYLLSSSYLYGQFTDKASGSTVDNLNIDKVKAAIIPLPPLAEQKRIVAKLDELLPLCESMK